MENEPSKSKNEIPSFLVESKSTNFPWRRMKVGNLESIRVIIGDKLIKSYPPIVEISKINKYGTD